MTHPDTPEVGGEAAPAEEATQDPFLAIAEEMVGQDEAPEEEAIEPEAEAESEDDDDIEIEDEAELPPIDPPVSLTAEEKESFKDLPRAGQEMMVRRIGELEKGFQAKAQEATRAREGAMREAAEYVSQLQQEAAQQLEQYAKQFTVPEPDPALIASDPVQYAQQVRAHQYYTAQRAEAQRKAEEARGQAQQYQAMLQQHEQEQFRQQLSEALPEFFDETKGPALREELTATAKFLGFSDEEIVNANANAIVGLKRVTELKADADRYRALMKKKMERVRAGKNPPPVTKPGAPRGNAQVKQQRANEAFAKAKAMPPGSARDTALAEYFINTGIL